MSVVAEETRRAFALLERIEVLEQVARSLPEHDERRRTLLGLVDEDLSSAPALRPRIAAELLSLSERTVRAWAAEGVLTTAQQRPRLLLDTRRVHDVLHLVKELRAAGRTSGLLDEVHRRIVDATWLDRDDLTVSIEQMHRGEGSLRSPQH